jgi:hypothetical protein
VRAFDFGLPKSSFLAGMSVFAGPCNDERGLGERCGMPSISKTRRLEGLRSRLGFTGRFLLQLAEEGITKSVMFKSDKGCLDMSGEYLCELGDRMSRDEGRKQETKGRSWFYVCGKHNTVTLTARQPAAGKRNYHESGVVVNYSNHQSLSDTIDMQ